MPDNVVRPRRFSRRSSGRDTAPAVDRAPSGEARISARRGPPAAASSLHEQIADRGRPRVASPVPAPCSLPNARSDLRARPLAIRCPNPKRCPRRDAAHIALNVRIKLRILSEMSDPILGVSSVKYSAVSPARTLHQMDSRPSPGCLFAATGPRLCHQTTAGRGAALSSASKNLLRSSPRTATARTPLPRLRVSHAHKRVGVHARVTHLHKGRTASAFGRTPFFQIKLPPRYRHQLDLVCTVLPSTPRHKG